MPSPLTLLINERRHIIRHVTTHTDTRFEGRYKGFDITVYLDDDQLDPDAHRYYIRVENPDISFGTAYDGWAPEETGSLQAAIAEALQGAQLTNPPRQQSPAPSIPHPGKYHHLPNPLDKLHPGETYFLIRAQDKFAPAAITQYASLLSASGDAIGAAECRALAKSALSWQQRHPDLVKHPD